MPSRQHDKCQHGQQRSGCGLCAKIEGTKLSVLKPARAGRNNVGRSLGEGQQPAGNSKGTVSAKVKLSEVSKEAPQGLEEDEWLDSGHQWMSKRVVRVFGTQKVGAVVTGWMPASAEDPALFHIQHDDGT